MSQNPNTKSAGDLQPTIRVTRSVDGKSLKVDVKDKGLLAKPT